MHHVSIIVATYNPDIHKLQKTLMAAAKQKDIDFEIIVTDDGSKQKDFSFLPKFFQSQGVQNYQIIENAENQGTVKNFLGAVRAAKGEYIFLTSPGDFLYDEYAMRDFYRFAKQNGAKLCFGNAVFYNSDDGILRLTREVGAPYSPQVYAADAPQAIAKASFITGNWVIGACYFRQREAALKYFEMIADAVVFLEDNSSTSFAMADGVRMYYYDRNIVWYEDGTGVSSSGQEKWKRILAQETDSFINKLKKTYPNNPYVDVMYVDRTEGNRMKRVVYKILRHPFILCCIHWSKKVVKHKKVHCDPADLKNLESLLTEE